MNDDFEILAILGGAIVVIAALVLGIAAGTHYFIDRPTCLAHWRNSPYEARWSFWGDCQISPDGKIWMTDDAYVSLHKQVTVHP